MILAQRRWNPSRTASELVEVLPIGSAKGISSKTVPVLERKVYIVLFGLVQVLSVEVNIEVGATVSSPACKLNSLRC